MKFIKIIIVFFVINIQSIETFACSMFYYIDRNTGRIFFVNNEDYWYDVKPYMQIIPNTGHGYGRIWYGWNKFGQGGINEKGLVLDGAVTPEEKIPNEYTDPEKGNMVDELLSKCSTVNEAIQFLEERKIALRKAHIFFGDKEGNAAIVEWIDGTKHIIEISSNRLVATNFNLSQMKKSDSTCWRYNAIQKGLDELESRDKSDTVDIKTVGNVIAKAVQPPAKDSTGKEGGTLYTSFIDLTEMKMILVYKLDNSKVYKLDILKELSVGSERKIKLK